MSTKQPEALRIAESFESFATDHKPEGWPAVQQKQLSEAAAALRTQHALLERAYETLDSVRMAADCGQLDPCLRDPWLLAIRPTLAALNQHLDQP